MNKPSSLSPRTINISKLSLSNYKHLTIGDLTIGDLVIRAKEFGDHYGTVVGYDESNEPLIAEYRIGAGPQSVSLKEFLQGYTIKNIERFAGSDYEREYVVYRYKNINQNNYRSYNFNDEQYARYIQTGKMENKQVTPTFTGLSIAPRLYFLFGTNND